MRRVNIVILTTKSEGSKKNSPRSVGDFALDCCLSIEWEL